MSFALSLELSVDNEDELPPTLEADGVDGRVRTSVFCFVVIIFVTALYTYT